MGLFTGQLSYLRYRVPGGLPDTLKDFIAQKLKTFAFREIDPGSMIDKSIGWVSAENIASTFFDDLHFARDPYMVFSLRVDVRRIPPLAMKAALLKEELKYREASGKERLTKKDKDMIKDEVWQRLIKKALPCPAVYDVCWNTSSETLLFFSTSKKANEDFVNFFHRSFDVKLTALTPAVLAGVAAEKHNPSFDIRSLESALINE